MPRRIRRFSLMAVGATLVGMLGLSTPAMAATPDERPETGTGTELAVVELLPS